MNERKKNMTVENGVRAMAGAMVLASLLLAYLVSPWWLCLTAFVGVNLLQSAFTGFCPAELILKRVLPGASEKRQEVSAK
jgi:hypothetical protein